MADSYRPYLVSCSKCGIEYARSKNRKFTCSVCLRNGYPRTFYRNRKIALIRDSYRCQCCGDKKNKIIVHHLDCDKNNNSPSNLITLCDQCHRSLHKKYSNSLLRSSNIYKLFPKSFVWGKFGKRPIYFFSSQPKTPR